VFQEGGERVIAAGVFTSRKKCAGDRGVEGSRLQDSQESTGNETGKGPTRVFLRGGFRKMNIEP